VHEGIEQGEREDLRGGGLIRSAGGVSGIPAPRILGQSRPRNVCRARVEFFRRAQNEAGATVTELGRMAGRSHVAVLRALERAGHEENQGPEH
jgi:putative transposase